MKPSERWAETEGSLVYFPFQDAENVGGDVQFGLLEWR